MTGEMCKKAEEERRSKMIVRSDVVLADLLNIFSFCVLPRGSQDTPHWIMLNGSKTPMM
jgi:hypothetical protein